MLQELRPGVQAVSVHSQTSQAAVPWLVQDALTPAHSLRSAYQLRMLCHLNAYLREDQTVVVPLGMQDGPQRQLFGILADQESQA